MPRIPGETLALALRWNGRRARLLLDDREYGPIVLEPRYGAMEPDYELLEGPEEIERLGDPVEPGSAELVVRVRDRDGYAVPGATIRLAGTSYGLKGTDSSGRARLSGLRAGPYEVWAIEPGYVFAKRRIVVPERSRTHMLVTEEPGRTVRVRILDERNRPASGARVYVHVPCYVRLLEDGTQHLAIYADADGCVDLPGLPREEVALSAVLGTRDDGSSVGPELTFCTLKLSRQQPID